EREIVEELGLDLKLGRVLLIFHGLSLGVWGDSTYYMYDGGVIAADTKITLQDAELVTYEWVAPENLEGYVRPSMVDRLRECYRAIETGETLEMSNLD
ncbi:MAG: NUDIX hydrolase, partial [Rothia mucilaginosa]|nr:NUDIX hydrolase [Rothia mucilaginosa]